LHCDRGWIPEFSIDERRRKMIRIARFFTVVSSVLILSFLLGATPAASAAPQEVLSQYVSDLQKNPSDYALREKIIRHVQGMRQKPAIPEEAERYMARGAAAVKGAKTEKDFQDAAAEFEKASLAAPWLPAVYYNLGITQDKAGKYKEAIQSLKLYLLAAPDASDAKAVKNLTYEIEYRQEKAARDARQAAPAPKQNTFEDLLRKIDGRRYSYPGNRGYTAVIDVRGKVLVQGLIGAPGTMSGQGYHESGGPTGRIEIRGNETNVPINEHAPFETVWAVASTFIIAEDGDRITVRTRYSDGDVRERIFIWQK
jgi:tetratricopeptide (TPR) repeat protein